MVDSDIINCCREYQKKKGNHSITDDYFYFMYPYSILIKNKLNFIFSKYSLDYIYNVDNLINDIVYQIVAYAKPQLFNYIILYEYEISEKEDLLEGNTNEEKLSWFIKELSNTEEWIEYCFEKYPVFTRILDKFTNNTLHYIEELISNFTQDFNDLHKLKINSKSRLNKITLFTGDLHNGRSVAFFEFANNVKLVYKPRCANNEIAFMEICSLLRSEGCLINVGIPKFLNRKNHTWYEFIKIEDISTIDELPAYYLNLGKLLCIFFVLGTNDIIPDNVISTGGIPYLIDLEVLYAVGKYLNNNELVKHSLTQANKISDQINSGKLVTCGDDHIEQLNGLFMGVAGVGYQFLRLLYWNDMPSILCLEWGRNNNKILH